LFFRNKKLSERLFFISALPYYIIGSFFQIFKRNRFYLQTFWNNEAVGAAQCKNFENEKIGSFKNLFQTLRETTEESFRPTTLLRVSFFIKKLKMHFSWPFSFLLDACHIWLMYFDYVWNRVGGSHSKSRCIWWMIISSLEISSVDPFIAILEMFEIFKIFKSGMGTVDLRGIKATKKWNSSLLPYFRSNISFSKSPQEIFSWSKVTTMFKFFDTRILEISNAPKIPMRSPTFSTVFLKSKSENFRNFQKFEKFEILGRESKIWNLKIVNFTYIDVLLTNIYIWFKKF